MEALVLYPLHQINLFQNVFCHLFFFNFMINVVTAGVRRRLMSRNLGRGPGILKSLLSDEQNDVTVMRDGAES